MKKPTARRLPAKKIGVLHQPDRPLRDYLEHAKRPTFIGMLLCVWLAKQRAPSPL